MRAKLLKKLRKKYSWYFNVDNFPVLLNHETRTVRLYDLEYMCERRGYTLQDVEKKVKVSHQEWALRLMKSDILSKYGYSLQERSYRIGMRVMEIRSKPKPKSKYA